MPDDPAAAPPSPPSSPALVWFRNDLRLNDNPALAAALARGGPVVPVHVLDDAAAGTWRLGGAARWWLHHALEALSQDLAARGSALVLRRGDSRRELLDLVAATGAGAVFWNRRYEPWAIAQDREVKAELKGLGVEARSWNGSLVREPWALTSGDPRPVTRFSFFAGLWLGGGEPPPPLPPAPARFPPAHPAAVASSVPLGELDLLPRPRDWATDFPHRWPAPPGEWGAYGTLRLFLPGGLVGYREARHRPGLKDGTSRLSAHLRFGSISPRQVWHLAARSSRALEERDRMPAFQRQLVWREFAYHLLYHFPGMATAPVRPGFAGLPLRGDDALAFRAWRRGQTGYPLVDAGMRELWNSGYMHNRARMVAASFLTKDLLIPWQQGAAWFWDTLCDADLANNSMGWQWVVGCGPDSAGGRFRMLNPVEQGRRFDPRGDYVRRWVPELRRLPDGFLHRPTLAPAAIRAYAGVRIGENYPAPIVDHDDARERAMAVYGGAVV